VLSGDVAPGTSLEAARAAGANVLAWGSFVTAMINFVILAFVIFLIVRPANKAMPQARRCAGRAERSRSAHRNPRRAEKALSGCNLPQG
jgi:large-conductance mechanosensitive channel